MSQTNEDIRDNVVKVVDSKGDFKGTGFFIEVKGNKYCITCHHCIYQLNQISLERNNSRFASKWDQKVL